MSSASCYHHPPLAVLPTKWTATQQAVFTFPLQMLFIVLVFSLTTPFLLNQTKAHCLSSSRSPRMVFVLLGPLGSLCLLTHLPKLVGGQGKRPGTLSCCHLAPLWPWAGHLTFLRLGRFISKWEAVPSPRLTGKSQDQGQWMWRAQCGHWHTEVLRACWFSSSYGMYLAPPSASWSLRAERTRGLPFLQLGKGPDPALAWGPRSPRGLLRLPHLSDMSISWILREVRVRCRHPQLCWAYTYSNPCGNASGWGMLGGKPQLPQLAHWNPVVEGLILTKAKTILSYKHNRNMCQRFYLTH